MKSTSELPSFMSDFSDKVAHDIKECHLLALKWMRHMSVDQVFKLDYKHLCDAVDASGAARKEDVPDFYVLDTYGIDYVEIPHALLWETTRFVIKRRIMPVNLGSNTCRLRHRLFTESRSELTDCADVFASVTKAIARNIASDGRPR